MLKMPIRNDLFKRHRRAFSDLCFCCQKRQTIQLKLDNTECFYLVYCESFYVNLKGSWQHEKVHH